MGFASLYENALDPLGGNFIFQETGRWFLDQILSSVLLAFQGRNWIAWYIPWQLQWEIPIGTDGNSLEFSEKPILKKNNQTCQGLLPRRNDEDLSKVLAETDPERDLLELAEQRG